MERFSRISRLIGEEKLKLLQHSRVTLVGVGAVGSYALEALARSGIGSFRLVDFDSIHPSNINRQLIALESTLGMNKVEAARNRVLDINPRCRVEVCSLAAGEDTLDEIFSPMESPLLPTDMLVDAIDSLYPKADILEYAWQQGIPAVSSMGAALRSDPAYIRIDDLMSTRMCPVAKKLRLILRKRGVGRGITTVYSTEEVVFDYQSAERNRPAEEIPDQRQNLNGPRHVLGSLPTLTGIFGLYLANTVIEQICGGFFKAESTAKQRKSD
ncbi:tRNA threonylcarbamoyladenosine dehydratase [Salinispira pacifica]|uniref:HesA/MoeB/ThiF family protein n=1 Tax=Salinispira pacifica TaxID=1307761 RepID=V5WII5_9SPIO|nr:tRNA threonylcarbamoyladenosine dehydratase [Salinispira pacifica]AHC14976.1 HesA/MoeB/ThiF family protein [Salinispira pacifica]